MLGAVALAGACLLASACGSSSEVVTTAPSQQRCSVSAQAQSATFAAAGGSGTLRITTNRECTWSVRSDAGWLAFSSPASGQGDGTLTYTVAPNVDPAARAAAISIEEQRLQISQAGSPCEYRLSSTRESLDPAGGDRTIAVTAGSSQCVWSAAADVPWITLLSGREQQGSGTVRFAVAAADGPPRTGTLRVAGQEVRVEQGTGCSFALGSTSLAFDAPGGSRDVPVSATAGCAWTAESNTPWLTVTGGAGSGPGVVTVRAAATEGPARTGTVMVAGQVVTVTQTPGCSVTVEPASHAVASAGGSGVVAVRAGTGCRWSTTSTAEWITLTAGESGTGTGEVRFTVAATSSPGRAGALRIGDATVTITQGSGCAFSLAPSSLTVGAAGGQSPVQVASGAGCSWSSANSAPWITITGGSGSGSAPVQIAAAANAGPAREAVVTIAGQSLRVAQASGCTYGVSPASHDLGGNGGSGAVSIATGGGCPWTAASQTDWISVPPSGSGPGQLSFSVAANPSPARTGTFTAAGQTITVNQASQCTWTFAPPSHAFDAAGGNGNVLMIVGGACAWSAASNNEWIRMTAGTSGAGSGLVQFTVTPNGGAARMGSLTIAGQRYEVLQSGVP
jgi:hypothetical protein